MRTSNAARLPRRLGMLLFPAFDFCRSTGRTNRSTARSSRTPPTRNENRLLYGFRSWTLGWMTSHTLSFIHLLLAAALAFVLFRFFAGRSAT